MSRDGHPLVRAALAIAQAGGPHARIRARRLVDASFGGTAPTAGDYWWAAGVLQAEGRHAVADLCGMLARLQPDIDAAAARWQERHGRGVTGRAEREFTAGGYRYRLGPPLRGIDGLAYQAGGRGVGPVLETPVVTVRAGTAPMAVLTGWDAPGSAHLWLRGRLAISRGPLDWSASRDRQGRLLGAEEQLLAWLLRAPWQLDTVGEMLRGYRWSTHVRDEVFAAARVTSWRGRPVTAATVHAEAAGRYAWAPDWAREEAGGPDTPQLARYVTRLAATAVTASQARQAAALLVARTAPRPAPAAGGPVIGPAGSGQRPPPLPSPAGPFPRM